MIISVERPTWIGTVLEDATPKRKLMATERGIYLYAV